jgi:hypothetical protein
MKKGDKYINRNTRRRVIITGIYKVKGKTAIITYFFGHKLDTWTCLYLPDFKLNYKVA